MRDLPPFEPPGSTPDRVFEFRYTVFTVSARLDTRRFEVRAGVRTSAVPLDRLQHLYVHVDRERGVDELLLSYAAPGGRLKRIRVFSDGGEAGFGRLVEALLVARPDIDIRHLDRRTAWDRTGSREMDRLVLPGMMAVAIVALGLMFAPRVLHGFDRGEATIAAEALARGERPETHNLIVEGRPLIDSAHFAEQDPDRAGQPTTAWIPVVGPDHRPADPVGVLIEVRNRDRAYVLGLAERSSFPGLLRDIWWEGLDGRRRTAMEKQGLRLWPDVAVVELGADPGSDLAIALGVVGLLSAMMLGVVFALRRRAQAAARTKRRAPLNRPRGPGLVDDED